MGAPERRSFAKGTVIFREGERGEEAYLLQQGRVRIFKTVAGKRITIGQAKAFEVFGELALIDDSPRMAGALVEEDCTCLVLSKATIRDMLDAAPAGLTNLLHSLIATMRSMGEELAHTRAELQDAQRD